MCLFPTVVKCILMASPGFVKVSVTLWTPAVLVWLNEIGTRDFHLLGPVLRVYVCRGNQTRYQSAV